MNWQSLEDSVRAIASMRWASAARPEHLGGVNFDAVVRPTMEELILIEVTKRLDLDKIRADITKINAYRLQQIAEGITVRSYVLTEQPPTTSMIETGGLNKVKVLSTKEFFNEYFQYDNYYRLRVDHTFGSALNPLTGRRDTIGYVPVRYQRDDCTENLDIEKIGRRLLNGEKLVLIGDYGTGKSRCVQRVFEALATRKSYPATQVFAINLREHWGATTAAAIVSGHLEELGLSGSFDNAMQIIRRGGAILLLDGVDEVGAQVFQTPKDNERLCAKQHLRVCEN